MIDYQWFDCGTGFKCPECGEDVVADCDDWIECGCGIRYIIEAHLYMAKDGIKIKMD